MAKADSIKDFDQEYDLSAKEGYTFRLGGHVFHTRGYVHPAAFLDTDSSHVRLAHFIRTVLIPEDREKFEEMMNDIDAPIDFNEQLPALSNWLVGEFSGRPTGSPVSSGNGDGGTSPTSKEASSTPVETGSK